MIISTDLNNYTQGAVEDELRFWLALHHAPGVGPATFGKILQQFGGVTSFFDELSCRGRPPWLNYEAAQWLKSPDWAAVDATLEWATHPQQHVITRQHHQYPQLLRETTGAPPLLYIKGDVTCLSDVHMAIVGSRNPTPDGRQQAYSFARSLSQNGVSIVSGLAMGIDTAAHQGALAVQCPTIAVVATGLDRVYPAKNRELAYEIAETGALVSEFPLGTPPMASYFPRRNRIISGLAVGTLVVEAGLKSGSLITARLALEQGREVFALPGSIHNPMVRGCHTLIRQGAKLIENVDHIFEELGPLVRTVVGEENIPQQERKQGLGDKKSATNDSQQLNEKEKRLLSCLGYEQTSTDCLVDRSGFLVEDVNAVLVTLELKGYVTSLPGGFFVKV